MHSEVPEGPPVGSPLPPNFSNWTEEQVAAAVGGLGPSKAWQRYAAVCVEEELDGPTMTIVTVESLVQDYNFKKPHAAVVVNYFQPKTPSQSKEKEMKLGGGLGLTEKEMKLMEPLVGQVERCRASCERLEEVLASLKSQKDQELERMDNWFQQAHEVLTQAPTSTTENIKKEFNQVHDLLTQYLAETRKAQQDIESSERTCLSFPAHTLSGIKERTANITSLVDKCLVDIASLENDPQLSVNLAPEILPFFNIKAPKPVAVVSLSQP